MLITLITNSLITRVAQQGEHLPAWLGPLTPIRKGFAEVVQVDIWVVCVVAAETRGAGVINGDRDSGSDNNASSTDSSSTCCAHSAYSAARNKGRSGRSPNKIGQVAFSARTRWQQWRAQSDIFGADCWDANRSIALPSGDGGEAVTSTAGSAGSLRSGEGGGSFGGRRDLCPSPGRSTTTTWSLTAWVRVSAGKTPGGQMESLRSPGSFDRAVVDNGAPLASRSSSCPLTTATNITRQPPRRSCATHSCSSSVQPTPAWHQTKLRLILVVVVVEIAETLTSFRVALDARLPASACGGGPSAAAIWWGGDCWPAPAGDSMDTSSGVCGVGVSSCKTGRAVAARWATRRVFKSSLLPSTSSMTSRGSAASSCRQNARRGIYTLKYTYMRGVHGEDARAGWRRGSIAGGKPNACHKRALLYEPLKRRDSRPHVCGKDRDIIAAEVERD